jgi:hypothetical protein
LVGHSHFLSVTLFHPADTFAVRAGGVNVAVVA